MNSENSPQDSEEMLSPVDMEVDSPSPLSNSEEALILDDEGMRSFCMEKIFTQNGVINSIAFTADGEFAITSSSEDQLQIYDCLKGTQTRSSFSKKFGCTLASFVHSPLNVIYASTKGENDDIRYLSLHENKFVRYFSGHFDKVTSLGMSPVDDLVLSASLDKTARLWDIRRSRSVGVIHLNDDGVTSFDPEGLLFAVGCCSDDTIRLYDKRASPKGPFAKFLLASTQSLLRNRKWTGLIFNPNGSQILLNTNQSEIYAVDAYHGAPLFVLESKDENKVDRLHANVKIYTFQPDRQCPPGVPLDVCYSADGKFIISANGNGSLLIWNSTDGRLVTILNPHKPSAVGLVKFNPKFGMMVSAGSDTGFWCQREEYITRRFATQNEADEESPCDSPPLLHINEG